MQKNEAKGTVSFAFETNDSEGLDILDNLRIAFLGDHEKMGGYVHSKRLIMEVKTGAPVEI